MTAKEALKAALARLQAAEAEEIAARAAWRAAQLLVNAEWKCVLHADALDAYDKQQRIDREVTRAAMERERLHEADRARLSVASWAQAGERRASEADAARGRIEAEQRMYKKP